MDAAYPTPRHSPGGGDDGVAAGHCPPRRSGRLCRTHARLCQAVDDVNSNQRLRTARLIRRAAEYEADCQPRCIARSLPFGQRLWLIVERPLQQSSRSVSRSVRGEPYRLVVTGATRLATQDDVPSWLELIPEAERLFGPMPTFDTHLLRAIDRGTALVVADQAKVVGGVLLSRDGQPHQIYWLYVRRSRRREGVGIALLEAVLERWPTGNVEVATFTADSPGGQPARALYERFGFICCGRTHPAPDGGPRDSFLLRR